MISKTENINIRTFTVILKILFFHSTNISSFFLHVLPNNQNILKCLKQYDLGWFSKSFVGYED